MPTVGKLDVSDVTIGWVKNSLEISPLFLSENLRTQIKTNPILEIIGDPEPMSFDSTGNLTNFTADHEKVSAH